MMNKREKTIIDYAILFPYVLFTILCIVIAVIISCIIENYNDICIGILIAWCVQSLLFLMFNSPFHIANILDHTDKI